MLLYIYCKPDGIKCTCFQPVHLYMIYPPCTQMCKAFWKSQASTHTLLRQQKCKWAGAENFWTKHNFQVSLISPGKSNLHPCFLYYPENPDSYMSADEVEVNGKLRLRYVSFVKCYRNIIGLWDTDKEKAVICNEAGNEVFYCACWSTWSTSEWNLGLCKILRIENQGTGGW